MQPQTEKAYVSKWQSRKAIVSKYDVTQIFQSCKIFKEGEQSHFIARRLLESLKLRTEIFFEV